MSQFLVQQPKTELVGPLQPAATSWSLSAVGCYEKCQLKAKFKYNDRIPEARAAAASRGVDFHKDIELFLTGGRNVLPEKLSYYHQWFTELKSYEIYPEHTITLNSGWVPVAPDSTERWYKGILDLKVIQRSSKHLSRERILHESEDNGPAEGNKEVVGPPKEAIIYDWKTGKIYPDHHDQRTLYSVAVFAEHPSVLSVRAIHVYVDLKQLREETFHRDQMYELRKPWEDRANQFLRALSTPEHMIPNPGYHCRWCGYSAAKGGPCRF